MRLHTLALALCTSAAISLATPSFADWRNVAPMPTAIQEIYTDTLDGKIYVAGGFVGSKNTFTDQFSAYDAKNDVWRVLSPLPAKRHHITLSSVQGKVYAMGGFYGALPDWQVQSSIFVYDPKLDVWASSGDMPTPRGEHVSAVVKDKIYIIGGRLAETPNTKHIDDYVETRLTQVYDPKTNTWTRLADAPTPRNSAAAGVINGKIYVVGGRQNQHDPEGRLRLNNLNTLEVYDPETDQWQIKAAMPLAQAGLAVAVMNDKLYAFGGEQWFPNEVIFNRTWVYDPKTDVWGEVEAMPTARHGLAAASIGKEIFVFGGSTAPSLNAVNLNQAFTPDTNE